MQENTHDIRYGFRTGLKCVSISIQPLQMYAARVALHRADAVELIGVLRIIARNVD